MEVRVRKMVVYLALGYCGLPYDGTCAQDGSPLWVLIGWDSVGLNPYRDLYIVGMEFFIGEGVEDFYGTVFVNNAQVLMCSPASRVRESEWNTMIFPEFISFFTLVTAIAGISISPLFSSCWFCCFSFLKVIHFR